MLPLNVRQLVIETERGPASPTIHDLRTLGAMLMITDEFPLKSFHAKGIRNYLFSLNPPESTVHTSINRSFKMLEAYGYVFDTGLRERPRFLALDPQGLNELEEELMVLLARVRRVRDKLPQSYGLDSLLQEVPDERRGERSSA